MKYIIGVDSGGTSTKTIAYDLEGNKLAETTTGFGNLLNNIEEALTNIQTSLENIFEKLGEEHCELVVLGVAGVDSGDFRPIIEDALKKYSPKVVILNDAWLAHNALLSGEDGALIIAGTGSIVIGKYEEKEGRVGGWGNLLGDEGSGYDIARKLIQKILTAFDRGRGYTPLEENFMKEANFNSPFELVKFVYSKSKDQIADLSMYIVEAAEQGDQEAIRLFELAGIDLAKQAVMLLKKLGMENQPQVAVTGSVLIKNDWGYESFKETVLSELSNCQFVREDLSNTLGAYYYYQTNKK